MIVVSNASPLITLARIGHLSLLPRLYSHLRIPTEVYNEVVIAGSGLPGAKSVTQADWIEVTALQDATKLARAQIETALGAGELSAVLLANAYIHLLTEKTRIDLATLQHSLSKFKLPAL